MADPFAGVAPPLTGAPYDPEKDREKIRGRVTLATTLVFGIVLTIYLYAAFGSTDAQWLRIKEAMQSVLPAISSVLGTVVGFYFGSQKR